MCMNNAAHNITINVSHILVIVNGQTNCREYSQPIFPLHNEFEYSRVFLYLTRNFGIDFC